MKKKGFRWRVWVSVIVMFCVILFLIYWFWALAEPYDFYQNIAIFIVTFLIAGSLFSAMWAPWGMKYNSQYHDPDVEQNKE